MADLPMFERTICDCAGCRVGCKTMPGALGAGDFERIAHYLGREADVTFLRECFAASEGTKVGVFRNGGIDVFDIPGIVPQQRENGECVFLDSDGACRVHPVSPEGCRMVDVHMSRAEGDARIKAGMNRVIREVNARGSYYQLHKILDGEWIKARPRAERRAAFELQFRLACEAGQVQEQNPREPLEPLEA